MRDSSRSASGNQYLACPACESGQLRGRTPGTARCASCGQLVDGGTLLTLRQIAALPDAIGAHACDCGHPEMRRLPDGVFRCPACDARVLPLKME